MKAEFDVQLQPKDLYRFNMFQTYTGMSGIISIALGILACVRAGLSPAKPDALQGYLLMYIVRGRGVYCVLVLCANLALVPCQVDAQK